MVVNDKLYLGSQCRTNRGGRVGFSSSQSQLNLAGNCIRQLSVQRSLTATWIKLADCVPLAAIVVTFLLPENPVLDGRDRGLRATLLNPLSPENELPRCTRLTTGFGAIRLLRKAADDRVDNRTLLPVRDDESDILREALDVCVPGLRIG